MLAIWRFLSLAFILASPGLKFKDDFINYIR